MLSIDEFLVSVAKLKPIVWPLLVGLSSAVLFYFQASRYSRFKPPDSDDLKSRYLLKYFTSYSVLKMTNWPFLCMLMRY
ncbi:hypothetical protein MACJ_003581 [Theileria orientalis]|uniref:Uncharacterized protein n=1 Tax=Theileria orientalis TaxID=68886 RepID=A0A976SLB8_THEOR|nr:hypothetical protein MACJ_003581 [Theileria orientalis]